MSLKNTTNQTIALAGIAQVCLLIQQFASNGEADEKATQTSIASILKIDAPSVVDIFGDLNAIRPGLLQLQKQITGRQIADHDQGRYAAQLVFLAQQLEDQPQMLNKIKLGVEKASALAESFGLMHENVLSSLGDLYHSTISTLRPRIMVTGDQQILAQAATADRIRALLLAGIRATLLWRQCGGARWKFLFFRKKIQDEIVFLLSQT